MRPYLRTTMSLTMCNMGIPWLAVESYVSSSPKFRGTYSLVKVHKIGVWNSSQLFLWKCMESSLNQRCMGEFQLFAPNPKAAFRNRKRRWVFQSWNFHITCNPHGISTSLSGNPGNTRLVPCTNAQAFGESHRWSTAEDKQLVGGRQEQYLFYLKAFIKVVYSYYYFNMVKKHILKQANRKPSL